MNPKIAIIILNWNGWKDTINCLETVFQSNYQDYRVILIDNGSTDGSIEKIQKWANGELQSCPKFFIHSAKNKPISITILEREEIANNDVATENNLPSKQVLIIKNERNYGFAEGNNIGIKFVFGDKDTRHIILLNNDTEVEPDWLGELMQVAISEKTIGACQPLMLSHTNPDLTNSTGISMSRFGVARQDGFDKKRELVPKANTEIFGACAGAALYNRDALEHIGLFDEDFFAYYEDVDLALRARLAGWKSMLVPASIIYHIHSATSNKNLPFKIYLTKKNEYYYRIKNLPMHIVICFLISRPYYILLTVLFILRDRNFHLMKPYLSANYMGFKNMVKMFRRRSKLKKLQTVSSKEVKGWFK